jgi:hypothetical protein
MNNLPDLGGMFAQMKLRDKLFQVSPESLIGLSIHLALEKKEPLGSICKTILTHYEDQPSVMLDVVPQDTIDLIKRIYSK